VILATLSSSSADHLLGLVFFLMVLVAGILKCAWICRRPTTNTKCVLSLMLLLVLWLLGAAFVFVFHDFVPSRVLYGLLGLLLLALLAAAMTMAILGLV
jgi:hypothetical protein